MVKVEAGTGKRMAVDWGSADAGWLRARVCGQALHCRRTIADLPERQVLNVLRDRALDSKANLTAVPSIVLEAGTFHGEAHAKGNARTPRAGHGIADAHEVSAAVHNGDSRILARELAIAKRVTHSGTVDGVVIRLRIAPKAQADEGLPHDVALVDAVVGLDGMAHSGDDHRALDVAHGRVAADDRHDLTPLADGDQAGLDRAAVFYAHAAHRDVAAAVPCEEQAEEALLHRLEAEVPQVTVDAGDADRVEGRARRLRRPHVEADLAAHLQRVHAVLLRDADVVVFESLVDIDLRVPPASGRGHVAHRKEGEPLGLLRVPAGGGDDDLVSRLPVHLTLHEESVVAHPRRPP